MSILRFFSTEEVNKFKSDITRLKVKRKIADRAIEFASDYVFYTKSFPAFIHCSKFSKIGRVDEDLFPMWLKRNLFIEVDGTYYPGSSFRKGKNKGFIVNHKFYIELLKLLDHDFILTGTIKESAMIGAAIGFKKKYSEELNGTKIIEYSEGYGGRRYHPLQGVKREIKDDIIFTDFNDFDISSAAPSILLQLYHNICITTGIQYNRFNMLCYVDDYVNNKDQVRQDFVQKYNVDSETSKKIINSLFNKSTLSANMNCMIFSTYFEYDHARMKMLQEDEYFKNLRRDIDFMWNKIESIFNPEVKLRKNKKTKRWYYYFVEESKVLDVIIAEITKITGGYGVFYEHDGFRLRKEYDIDIPKLEETIFNKTGYKLQICGK